MTIIRKCIFHALSISISSRLKKIQGNYFQEIPTLEIAFNFPLELEALSPYSFAYSNIEKIVLPPHFRFYWKHNFCSCRKFKDVKNSFRFNFGAH
jgi:hypothetical protein